MSNGSSQRPISDAASQEVAYPRALQDPGPFTSFERRSLAQDYAMRRQRGLDRLNDLASSPDRPTEIVRGDTASESFNNIADGIGTVRRAFSVPRP